MTSTPSLPSTYTVLCTPVGELTLVVVDGAVTAAFFADAQPHLQACQGRRDDAACATAASQLGEYFAGQRTSFDLPLAPAGTTFQHRVWRALRDIPHGHRTTYGEIAAALDQPTASRAVGTATGKNPISIIVPCHRVVGADGKLTGYAGGLTRKKWLLGHEESLA